MKPKIFLGKRSKFSDSEAIFMISKYGIARVIDITEDKIVEEFIEFEKTNLTLLELATLAREIHQNKRDGQSLVHGDFGLNNTTIYRGVPKCYDYEHVHFGNKYVDLGRVVLRSCKSIEEVETFLERYNGRMPFIVN